MNDSPWYINALERITNTLFSCLPSPKPSLRDLQKCKIVGHRGAHLGTPFIENSLEGFIALAEAKVWGAEMDIRWTQDLVPVISHDPDCRRLFQQPLLIANTPFAKLREQVPLIPSLEEVVNAVGKRLHLMLEIKQEYHPQPAQQSASLQDILSPLKAERDYHFLTLDRTLFSLVSFAPLTSQVLVSILNTKVVSAQASEINYGGIAGAYPFFTQKIRQQHRRFGQKIGVGHIDSKRLLFQQIAKGTDWIFSNRALKLQTIIQEACQ